MPSVGFKSSRRLTLVLLLTPLCICLNAGVVLARGEPVRPKTLQLDDSKWTSTESKHQQGMFDNLVDKQPKKPLAKSAAIADSSDATEIPQTETASDSSAGGSTSDSGTGWVWAILGSLLVVGGGLTCFGYYWSNVRRVASW
ncbi:MAG TPA: hypothetical protein VHY91_12515 [Pirellulales bacterium]|jgi:hypothetical protein|nr:hypothetical protein [Pirellulales bacterium]